MNASHPRPIVVGYDGPGHGDDGVTWAARTAMLRGAPLTLVTVVRPPMSAHAGAALFGVGPMEAEADHLRGVLDDQVDAVRGRFPELDVQGQFVIANPALTLIEASETAELVVIGRRRLHGLAAVLGGTGDHVVSHARGPIAVVPENTDAAHSGPVVVGVESLATSDVVLDVAAREAELAGRELLLLHAWDVRVPWRFDRLADPERIRDVGLAWEEVMGEDIDRLRNRFPAVAIRTEVVPGSAVDALVEWSQQASVVVVGSHGRGGFAGMVLGSTSRRLLQSSHSPAIVVPTPRSE